MNKTNLFPTTSNDLDFVIAAESDPENANFVYQWSKEEHLKSLTNPNFRHYIIRDVISLEPCGYLILEDIENPSRSISLRRLVVTKKGFKIGEATLYQAQKIVFEEFHAHRLWLDVFIDNTRAYKLYLKTGFRLEGQLIDSYLRYGQYISQYILAMLDSEYEEGRN